eukprot:TRINITY_DN123531_c0_g1_i1.p1 TRINITY_DN123531_c0_g1~~TRINITY_DN123531_c0_g1_i1.p1  ORF type:complete len:360 (-),score=83.56 TRINITY_DN123531_c0_g1_i1:111-1190(-)
MAHPGGPGEFDALSAHQRVNIQDLDVTVLAFAQWLSEMRSRSNTSLQQMLAEMGIIRNGITSNNTDLTEFKRNTATVQQQMQSQISDLRDKLTDAYTEIANMKKSKSQFEQEVHAEYQSLSEQLQFKTLELETLKKHYASTHQQLQQQILQLQNEVVELGRKGDDAHRQNHMTNEQHVNKVGEVESVAHSAHADLKRLRNDHDQAISNLAENMNRWNDTLRDLSKEFHNFQKVMNVNQQRIQSTLWDVQAVAKSAPPVNGAALPFAENRMETSSDTNAASRSPGSTRQAVPLEPTARGPLTAVGPLAAAQMRAQSPSGAASARRPTAAPATATATLVPSYAAAPAQASPPVPATYSVLR